ncbi:MAG: efflux RND transporter periplasmic adaptor subunit [Acidobacteria bacterium]|nr:efflux RND transporter periplasmic adaptor subunit [Acidobacteriota bacterium]
MNTKLPWFLTVLLAVALVFVVITRPASQGDGSGKAGEKKVLYWVDPMNPENKSDKPGKAPDGMDLVPVYDEENAAPAKAEKKVLFWVDPMHPAYKSDKPGTAPDCGMDLVPVYEGDEGPEGSQSDVEGYSKVKLTTQRQQLIGVQTGVAETRAIGRRVRTVGRVAVDETRLHKITTKFDGYIEKLYVDYTGKEVRRGQPLFSVYSPELLATQQEYLLALRAADQSPLLLEAARRRLQLWDISSDDIRKLEKTGETRKNLTIYSPANGFVITKNAVEGARILAGEPMFEIAGLDRVWILADVYESELAAARLGVRAAITLSYLPGRTFDGTVTFVTPTVDSMTRTAKVRVEVDNRDGALKPEMFADVVIQEPERSVTVVPESAVISTGTRSVLFVVKDDGMFEPREIETGVKSERYVEIRSGIEPGEKVATQANFLIDSESRLKAALAQMSGPGGHSGHGQ